MKIRPEIFLNYDEIDEIKANIKLLSKETYGTNDYIESGGFGVRKDCSGKGVIVYEIYRIIGEVRIPKKKARR